MAGSSTSRRVTWNLAVDGHEWAGNLFLIITFGQVTGQEAEKHYLDRTLTAYTGSFDPLNNNMIYNITVILFFIIYQ
jgi:hypothetical protein